VVESDVIVAESGSGDVVENPARKLDYTNGRASPLRRDQDDHVAFGSGKPARYKK
jgi:hypothetical protein